MTVVKKPTLVKVVEKILSRRVAEYLVEPGFYYGLARLFNCDRSPGTAGRSAANNLIFLSGLIVLIANLS